MQRGNEPRLPADRCPGTCPWAAPAWLWLPSSPAGRTPVLSCPLPRPSTWLQHALCQRLPVEGVRGRVEQVPQDDGAVHDGARGQPHGVCHQGVHQRVCRDSGWASLHTANSGVRHRTYSSHANSEGVAPAGPQVQEEPGTQLSCACYSGPMGWHPAVGCCREEGQRPRSLTEGPCGSLLAELCLQVLSQSFN